ncbi:MAG: hypothetical protein R3253_11565, partial [Longimicrobiales bacterium]|nr:hypothetical protein [Longimicrobiales bacterium]
YIDRYPDDPDGWFLLGEAGLHAWSATGVTDEELEEALYRTVELDPTFGPYYEHALHWATAKGHEAMYDSLVVAAEQVGDAEDRQERMRLRWALFQGDEEEQAAAEARLAALEPIDVQRVDQSAIGLLDEELERLEPLWSQRDDGPRLRARLYGQQGRLADMVQLAEAAGGDALAMAVFETVNWMGAGAVPQEIPGRLDRLIGSPSPDDEGYELRVALDLAERRSTDVEAFRRWLDREMNEWLPRVAQMDDTVGIRRGMMAAFDADVLLAEGRPEEAYQIVMSLQDLTALEPPPDLVVRFGVIALEAGEYDHAIRALEGVSRGLERTLVKFHLGRAYEATGDTARAIDAYRTFLSRTAPADEQLGAVIQAREAVRRLGGG